MKKFQGTQIKIFRYMFHGRHNPSTRIGECAGTFGRRCFNAPLRIFQRLLHLKENSLILSATIEGKRIENIEVSLRTLEVVQSRGMCNKNTEYHEQIVNLVNANRGLINRRMKAIA